MTKTLSRGAGRVLNLMLWSFEFVSDFVLLLKVF